MKIKRRDFISGIFFLAGLIKSSSAELLKIQVYKTPSCGCCSAWVEHIKRTGFHVNSEDVTHGGLAVIKKRFGVPAALSSCHTAFIGNYFIEGHVPAEDIKALLYEKPEGLGLSVPNMPIGSPGMEVGDHKEPYDTLLIKKDGSSGIFRSHRTIES